MTSFAVENRYEKTSGAVSFFYNWGNHWINDGYTPPTVKLHRTAASCRMTT